MALLNKRIFAGKSRLQPEPFCPFISDKGGYVSLKKTFDTFSKPSQPRQARPKQRGGKSQI